MTPAHVVRRKGATHLVTKRHDFNPERGEVACGRVDFPKIEDGTIDEVNCVRCCRSGAYTDAVKA